MVRWREFEELVARIEKQLSPKGAVIKSPDYIVDNETGKQREVDASIRYRIGSASVLITIECRCRSRVEDDTWLEQLIGKKSKIGADKTIAVSRSGFSDSARKTAQRHGIELRVLREITDCEIASWINLVEIYQVRCFDRIMTWTITTDSDDDGLSEALQRLVEENPNEAKVLFRGEDGAELSVRDLVESFYQWQSEGKLGQESYVGLDQEGVVGRRITIEFKAGSLYTHTRARDRANVVRVVIDLETKVERHRVPMSHVYGYSDLHNQISQIAVGKVIVDSSEGPRETRIYVQPSI